MYHIKWLSLCNDTVLLFHILFLKFPYVFKHFFRQIVCFCTPWKILPFRGKKFVDAHGSTFIQIGCKTFFCVIPIEEERWLITKGLKNMKNNHYYSTNIAAWHAKASRSWFLPKYLDFALIWLHQFETR